MLASLIRSPPQSNVAFLRTDREVAVQLLLHQTLRHFVARSLTSHGSGRNINNMAGIDSIKAGRAAVSL